MKAIISAAVAAILLSAGVALAEESKPIELTEKQLDQVTAAGLGLPNGREVFAGFDNAAPGPLHPALLKFFANGQPASEGPWQAHYNSPVIVCIGCP
ncbi:MAG: hypothetical protein HKN84_12000 [Gammaproteobacteria bacterium]|nr:hypothetical protein [Gammaproteobacteria bacterium]